MKMTASTAFAIACVPCLVGCYGYQSTRAGQQSAPSQAAVRQPELTRDEVLQIFRDRATPDQLREFEQLRAKTDPDSRERALSLVLCRLTNRELPKIGILPSIDLRPMHWLVVGHPCGKQINEALSRVLQPEHIFTEVVAVHLGMCYRDVPREQFFRARRVLSAAPDLKALGVVLVEPMFDLE